MPVITGEREFFKNVPAIKFEGAESDNPFAFLRCIILFPISFWERVVGIVAKFETKL